MRSRTVPLLIVLALVIAAAGIYRLNRTTARQNAIRALSDSVRALRLATDSCSAAVRAGEVALQRYSERLDSLHTHVRAFESQQPRVVPAEQYREYLEAFELYSDSTAVWQDRVDTLQTRLAQCRVTAHAHNDAVDSLRVLLDQ